MDILKRVMAVYCWAVAVIVAAYFMLTLFLTDESAILKLLSDSETAELDVWLMVDALMALAVAITLIVNVLRKLALRDDGEEVTREYLEVNVGFYSSILLALWFYWNWFYTLFPENEPETVELIHLEWWTIVNPMVVLVVGATAFHLWRDARRGE